MDAWQGRNWKSSEFLFNH